MATTTLLRVEDLDALPDDGFRYELDRGVLVRMPPPKLRHGVVANRFAHRLTDHVEEHGLGLVGVEGGFVLARDPDRVVSPDVFFLRAERVPPEEEPDTYVEGAPDLAVEVLSPSDSMSDDHGKVLEYLEAGARLVLLLDRRRRTATVFGQDRRSRLLTAGEDLDLDEAVPGFRVRVGDLYR